MRDDYCDSDSCAIGSDGHHRCRYGERCPFHATDADAARFLAREKHVDRMAARMKSATPEEIAKMLRGEG